MTPQLASIRHIEKAYMVRRKRQKVHIACELLDFVWDKPEVKNFRKMWREGVSLKDMAKHFERDIDEILILVIDQSRKGLIDQRKQGIWG